MDENILNSVIEITNKRDTDSLEISMSLALVEQIKCLRLIIYKRVNAEHTLTIRSNIDLIVHDTKSKYEWLEPEFVQNISDELNSCFKFSCLIHNKLENENEESWHPIVIGQQTVAVIYLNSIKLSREQQVLLNGFCRIYENYLSILKESECDKLTGLLNRQTFEVKVKRFSEQKNKKQLDELNSDNKRAPHQSISTWLAIIDLDNFKRVNDQFGHVCGDEVLLTFAQLMKKHFRNEDLLFRFGGEEFILVMEAPTSKILHIKLNEFKNAVNSHQFPFIESLTVSIGFTLLDPNMFISSIVDRADKALYYAKDNGRNTIHCFEDLIEQKLLQRHDPALNSPVELF
ncbi:GGDEF domain-containing protein [Colwellia sp. 75C3]|uniref:GGDEF domain-containing protein n=1 Tax=Colwellia sp. 75C3 TaxID=888425 RepID=UPI000C34B69B|nr:GGDEF domain-containing protein [Colwellia sp. 75C3]PKG82113.1 GGDEF domain-containing protein [Colwellia sp. 75C3]